MKLLRTAAVVVVAAALIAPVAIAGDPEEDKKKEEAAQSEDKPAAKPEAKPGSDKAPAAADDTVVITNEMLEERYASGGTGVSGTGATITPTTPPADGGPIGGNPPKLPDAVQQMDDEQARKRTRESQIAEAQDKVSELEAKVQMLEKRQLAVVNPFLPRPQIPSDQREGWDAMTAPERLEKTRADRAEAQAELDAARKELADLQSGT